MKTRLFVVTNLWIFLEEMSIADKNEFAMDYFWLSDKYVKDKELRKYVQKLDKGIIQIQNIKMFSKFFRFDEVYSPSQIGDGTLLPLKAGRYVLVEEGTYDYKTDPEDMKDKKIRKNCEIYTSLKLPNNIAKLYKAYGSLKEDDEIEKKMETLFESDMNIPDDYNCIFVTSPLKNDFDMNYHTQYSSLDMVSC